MLSLLLSSLPPSVLLVEVKSFLKREGTRDPDLSQSVHPIPVATVIGGGMVIPPNGS